jgi:ATP adenylyltransferase
VRPERAGGAARGRILLERDTLWARLVECSAHAAERGGLVTIPTRSEVIEDGGVPFVVRTLLAPDAKRRAKRAQRKAGVDPFLPYEPDLFVADVSDTHLALLNKFNVVDHHLLLVTREFEPQDTPLARSDFEALWACMREFDALAFYNAGEIAGASQPHRHLQLVPVPLGPGLRRAPIEAVLEDAHFDGPVGRAVGLPVLHAYARLRGCSALSPSDAADRLLALYREMSRAFGCDAPGRPYNLLLTREWMLFVPRAAEKWEGNSINSLGFAGALLARTPEKLEAMRRAGPMTALRSVGISMGRR